VLTHADLVTRAARWLASTRRCVVVLTECGSFCTNQIPDALGWTARGEAISVECKTSVSDFYADRQKPSHRSNKVLGQLRYYLVPPGLIGAERVQDRNGLLWCYENRIKVVRHATPSEGNRAAELQILIAEMRRIAEGFRKPGAAHGLFLEKAS
jgi:hypothetical protein